MALDPVADAAAFLTDVEAFAQPITVTSPAGDVAELAGAAAEIGQRLEPETGQLVSGTSATVALPLGSLQAAFSTLPVNVPDASSRPWVVTFVDAGGMTRAYKVVDTQPDRRMGVVKCVLEAYRP